MSKKRKALLHGLCGKIMLWSEKYEDYEALRAGLYREYAPTGSSEEYWVQTLVDLLWRRRRLDLHERITLQKQLDKIRNGNEHSRHIQNLRELASDFSEADSAEKVEALLAPLSPLYRNTILRDSPLLEGEDPSSWGAKIAKGLSAWKQIARCEDADEFIAMVDLEQFDATLNRIERLDAMIDRALKRLMQIKTMKQMYDRLEPKLITVTKEAPTKESSSTASSQISQGS